MHNIHLDIEQMCHKVNCCKSILISIFYFVNRIYCQLDEKRQHYILMFHYNIINQNCEDVIYGKLMRNEHCLSVYVILMFIHT